MAPHSKPLKSSETVRLSWISLSPRETSTWLAERSNDWNSGLERSPILRTSKDLAEPKSKSSKSES